MPAQRQQPLTASSSYPLLLDNEHQMLIQLKHQLDLETMGGIRQADGWMGRTASNYGVVTPSSSFVFHQQPRPREDSMVVPTNEWNQHATAMLNGDRNTSPVEKEVESVRCDRHFMISNRGGVLGIGNDHFVLSEEFDGVCSHKMASSCCNSDDYDKTKSEFSPAQVSYSDASLVDDFEDTVGQKLRDEDEDEHATGASRVTLLELTALIQRERRQETASIATIEDLAVSNDEQQQDDDDNKSLAEVHPAFPDPISRCASCCFSSEDEEEGDLGDEESGDGVYTSAVIDAEEQCHRVPTRGLLQPPQQSIDSWHADGTKTNDSFVGRNVEITVAVQDPATYKAQLHVFDASMAKSQKSQQAIHDWDRKMGLKRSHSKTMRLSARSRKKLRLAMKEACQAIATEHED